MNQQGPQFCFVNHLSCPPEVLLEGPSNEAPTKVLSVLIVYICCHGQPKVLLWIPENEAGVWGNHCHIHSTGWVHVFQVYCDAHIKKKKLIAAIKPKHLQIKMYYFIPASLGLSMCSQLCIIVKVTINITTWHQYQMANLRCYSGHQRIRQACLIC